MFSSYIMDKAGFTILCMLIGGENVYVPEHLCDAVNEDNYEGVLKKLADYGYVYVSHGRIDIERTINFLISCIIGAENIISENNGKRYIFRCSKLTVIIEEDRLTPKKCRIIPIKDDSMLTEYYSECNDNINYNEE